MKQEQTVGELATERPASVKVFHRHGIDFCCGGGISLEQACEKRGLDAAEVRREIEDEEGRSAGDPQAWGAEPLGAVIDHIVESYHRPLDEELPRLEGLARKVARVHGENHPELQPLLEAYLELQRDLVPHMMKEEHELFPAVRSGDARLVLEPIEASQQEHEVVGGLLMQIHRLSGGFEVPEDACGSFRALFNGLADLERSLHEHIHLENNILFPRALRE